RSRRRQLATNERISEQERDAMNEGSRSKSRWRAEGLGVGFAVFALLAIVVMLQALGSGTVVPGAATEEARSRTDESDSPRPVVALEAGDRIAVAPARTSPAAANTERAPGFRASPCGCERRAAGRGPTWRAAWMPSAPK